MSGSLESRVRYVAKLLSFLAEGAGVSTPVERVVLEDAVLFLEDYADGMGADKSAQVNIASRFTAPHDPAWNSLKVRDLGGGPPAGHVCRPFVEDMGK